MDRIEPLVGSRCDDYENSFVDSIYGLYKPKLIRRDAPYETQTAAELANLSWMHSAIFLLSRRKKISIGSEGVRTTLRTDLRQAASTKVQAIQNLD